MESIMEGENMPTAPRPQTGPTFEDLTLDDTLDDMQRIMRYSTSALSLQRLVHVKMLATTAQANGFERTRECLFPLFDTIAADEEFMLRQHLAEQLRGVAEVCVRDGGEEGYRAMLDHVLPVLSRLVADNQAEVRIAAGESLVAVAGLVKKEDMGPRVLTVVLQLAHDDEMEDLRMTAAVLLNELAETLGPELCHQFVTPEVICLAEDSVFRVRKAAALNLDAVCRTAGPQMAMKRLVPAFLRLCQDDIWGVRKSCAESLVAVSKCLDPQVRVTELIPMFERFATDPSKWVRNAAFQHLGPFLATLPGAKIPSSLLAHYIKMGFSPEGSSPATTPASQATTATSPGGTMPARLGTEPGDAELAVYCAFSFPAVVMTLGRNRWPELKPLFQSLSRDVQKKVRRPISHSLHEIARILGPELAESDLLPAFELYLKDVDEVKTGIVRNLAAFLNVLSPSTRESYLPVLDDILSETSALNWRSRSLLATQLPQLSTIFSPAATFSVVYPFAMKLLVDPIASVREEAAAGMVTLINRLGAADPAFQLDLLVRLARLATSRCYRERLLFVKLCGYLGHASTGIDAAVFRRHFVKPLLALTGDKTINVRLAVAKTLAPLSEAVYMKEEAASHPSELAIDESPVSPPASTLQPTPASSARSASRTFFGLVSSFVPTGKVNTSAVGFGDAATTTNTTTPTANHAATGIDNDLLPLWARQDFARSCDPLDGIDPPPCDPAAAVDDAVAVDVLQGLETIAQDKDLEVVRSLHPEFVRKRRVIVETPAAPPDAAIVLTLEEPASDLEEKHVAVVDQASQPPEEEALPKDKPASAVVIVPPMDAMPDSAAIDAVAAVQG